MLKNNHGVIQTNEINRDAMDFDGDIVLSTGNGVSSMQAQNGVAVFEFTADTAGDYTVTVSGDQTVIKSAEIKITAQPTP